MGGGSVPEAIERLAFELGRAVAREGWILLNGGRDAGVMAASARGARAEDGLVVGILPGHDAEGAAPDLTVAIVTGLGDARNVVNVLSSDMVVALPGGAGTLSEIALALKSGRPVVLLGWPEGSLAELDADVDRVASVREAIERVRSRLQ